MGEGFPVREILESGILPGASDEGDVVVVHRSPACFRAWIACLSVVDREWCRRPCSRLNSTKALRKPVAVWFFFHVVALAIQMLRISGSVMSDSWRRGKFSAK